MSDLEVEFSFFEGHIREWHEFETDLRERTAVLERADLPTLSSRFPDTLRELIENLNGAQDKFARNVDDAAEEAALIAEGLLNSARIYIEGEAENEALAAEMITDLEENF